MLAQSHGPGLIETVDGPNLPSNRETKENRRGVTHHREQFASFVLGLAQCYYVTRFAFSAVWVGIAFTIAKSVPPLTALMLVGYPWWDAVANYVDAGRSGGLRRNKSH